MLKKIKRIVILIILAFVAVVGWVVFDGYQFEQVQQRAMDFLGEP
jgi:predicted negative regulator of RcsB-dependent stress response